MSDTKEFTVQILPINNAPFFELSTNVIHVLESSSTTTHEWELVLNSSISKGPPIPSLPTENATISTLQLFFWCPEDSCTTPKLDQPQEQLDLRTLIGQVLDISAQFIVISLRSSETPPDSGLKVGMTLSMPMSVADFGNTERLLLIRAIAGAADVPASWVSIVSISEEQTGRRRRLLAVSLKIVIEIVARDANSAVQIMSNMEPENLNAQLREVGMGAEAELLEMPQMVDPNACAPGFGGPNCEPCRQDIYGGACSSGCSISSACSGHGRCRGWTGLCECSSGWHGTWCNAMTMGSSDANTEDASSSWAASERNDRTSTGSSSTSKNPRSNRKLRHMAQAGRRLLAQEIVEVSVELWSWPETTSAAQVMKLQTTLQERFSPAQIEIDMETHSIPPHQLSDDLILNENDQNISFSVVLMPAEDIPENNGPIILTTPLMYSNGTLMFTVSAYRYGNSSFQVLLRDDGGVERNGSDTSASLSFMILVLPVNDAPSFDIPHPFLETLELGPGEFSVIDNAVTNISKGPPLGSGISNEDYQDVTFVVSEAFSVMLTAGVATSTWDVLVGSKEPQLVPNGTLVLWLSPYLNGTTVLNISLKDAGGTELGGEDSSRDWKLLTIKVLSVNQAPTFELQLTVIHAIEAPRTREAQLALAPRCRPPSLGDADHIPNPHLYNISIDGVASEIQAGPPSPEEDKQSMSFSLMPLQCRIPSGVANSNHSDMLSWTLHCPGLYGGGAHPLRLDAQLFQRGTAVEVDLAGTLSFMLEPERFGTASFMVKLEDNGAGLDSVYGASRNQSSSEQPLLIIVDPVNNPPSFVLMSCQLEMQEMSSSESAVLLPQIMRNISHGGWREADSQVLSFEIIQIAGPIGVGYGFEAKCDSNSDSYRSSCYGESAAIEFFLSPGRWGNITLQITLKDSGGGSNTFFDIMDLHILPVNNAPTFRLRVSTVYANERQDVCCDLFILHDFIAALSLGPWEDADAPECQSGIECERQQGRFVVTSRDPDVSSRLFELPPRIYPNGTLVLALKVRANSELFGTGKFIVTLVDENSLDGTSQVSKEAIFDIEVLAVNSHPSFNITQPAVNVDEDSGSHEFLIADSIQADGSINNTEADQTVTFTVSVDAGSSIFTARPEISRLGVLSFTLAADAFGKAVLRVGLKDDGGSARGGQDTAREMQAIVITVIPINDPPSFESDKERELTVAPTGTLTIVGFASHISVGPSNERNCFPESVWCQKQSVSFEIIDVTNPLLFQSMLHIDDHGTLTGMLAEEPTGYTIITFRAIDDGVRYGIQGMNASATLSTLLKLKSGNQPPFFSFPWTARCALPLPSHPDLGGLGVEIEQDVGRVQCECTPASPGSECLSIQSDPFAELNTASSSISEVYGREGEVQVDFFKFATEMTPVAGTRRSASITFAEDQNAKSGLKVAAVIEEGRSEYHVSSAESPDGRHLYVAEVTDSIAVYSISNSSNTMWLDRRSHREDRVRFAGPQHGAEPGLEEQEVVIERFSTAASVEIEGHVIIAVACGAIDLPDALEIARKNSVTRNLNDGVYALAVGHWDFSQRSVVSDSVFVREINRERSCKERSSTRISPSSIAGLGRLGRAELRGPQCKENSGTAFA